MKSFSARVLAVVAVLSLLANVLLYMRYSTSRPFVTVGSEVITKRQYQDELEHQAGQQVLSKLVFTKLVMQAAAREGVTPTSQDVAARIQVLERRSPQALAPYSQDAAKMDEFRQDLMTTIALENLRIKNVSVTPAQVADYYAKHRADFALPQQVKTTTVVTQNAVDAATAADLLSQNQPPDVIGRQPRLHVVGVNGYRPNFDTLSSSVKQQISSFVQKAEEGDVKTFHAAPFFLTFQVTKNNSAVLPPLASIHDQVEHMARLERASLSPQNELAQLYQTSKPKFQNDKYEAYFSPLLQTPLTKGKETASVASP